MDFSKINDFGRGQTDSFEDLLKVLARREKVDDAVEFQPNDGRGGDGGVEALWLLNDGSKVGYQSKFFSSLEDAQWRLKWSGKFRQRAKMYPALTTGYRNDDMNRPEFFGDHQLKYG